MDILSFELENVKKIYNLADLGLLRISGVDAKKLLQGQFTCHLEEVTEEQGRMGAHCNPQGKIVSLFYLFQLQHAYYLLMPRELVPITMMSLKKYAVFYKVILAEANDEYLALGYTGPSIAKKNANYPYAFTQIKENRHLILGTKDAINQIWQHLSDSIPSFALKEWQELDWQDGIPSLYAETTGKFFPHDLNLDKLGAIHFDKGCYTGQEIIARMHYRGKPKKHMYQASLSSSSHPLPGVDIYYRDQQNQNNKVCGTIVTASHEIQSDLHHILLVTDKNNAKNHHLFLHEDETAFFILS